MTAQNPEAADSDLTAVLEQRVPWLLALALAGYAVFLWCFMGAYAGAADSSGYLNSARMLAHGEFITAVRPITGVGAPSLPGIGDYLYAPLGFRPMLGPGTMSPIYPIGLPLLLAVTAAATNWTVAPGLTMGLHMLLGVLLVYVLGRESGLPRGWSALGAVVLAVGPLYLFMGLVTMSDVPALVWVTAGMLCAWRARRHRAWAGAAGLVLGFSVLVRPTNALLLLPAVIAIGADGPRLLWFALGGLAPAVALLRYNLGAYGSMFASGYFNRPDSFAWHRLDSTLIHYVRWLPVLLTPLGVAALFLPWARGLSARWKVFLGAWALVILGFYACYLFTHMTWWFLRYLLPAFPPLIVAALHVLRGVSGKLPGRTVPPPLAWVAVVAMVLLHDTMWSRPLHPLSGGKDELAYKVTVDWMQTHLPAGAAIWTMQDSGALFYYTDFTILRWDMVQPREFLEITGRARAAGTPVYAALQDFEKDDDAFPKHIPGHWEKVERVRATTVWKFISP